MDYWVIMLLNSFCQVESSFGTSSFKVIASVCQLDSEQLSYSLISNLLGLFPQRGLSFFIRVQPLSLLSPLCALIPMRGSYWLDFEALFSSC